jgi:hypothetical protein
VIVKDPLSGAIHNVTVTQTADPKYLSSANAQNDYSRLSQVHSAQVCLLKAPVQKRQYMPFSTRRSSTRGTPPGLFGNTGLMITRSKSLNSYLRGDISSLLSVIESHGSRFGNPFYELMT